MPELPRVNWRLSLKLAPQLAGELPEVTRPMALQLVSDLRLVARTAGELAQATSGLPSSPSDQVMICDRQGWARGAAAMTQEMLDGLPSVSRTGQARPLAEVGYGVAAGVALGLISRALLGQFDMFSRQPRLFLIAPNILQMEQARSFVAKDFRLWVAVHEQTHALQYGAADWLQGFLLQQLASLLEDRPNSLIGGLTSGQGLGGLLLSAEAQRAVTELSAVMTFLEGHADLVSDEVGKQHIPTWRMLRRAFRRSHRPGLLARVLPALDKAAQYREGLAFCRSAADRVGLAGLGKAFESAEAMPTSDEIANPSAWVGRVHG